MYKLSEFISQPVLSVYEGKKEGYIKTAIFDSKYKKLKYLVIFDDDDDIVENKSIDYKDIYYIGQDAILVRNDGCVKLEKSIQNNKQNVSPINNTVYDTNGKFLGKIVDVIFDDKFNLTNFVLDNGQQIATSNFISNCNGTMLVQTNHLVNIKNFKPNNKTPKIYENAKVFALHSENEFINKKIEEALSPAENKIPTIKIERSIRKNIETEIPNKITSNVSFLIGRKATQNILNQNNEIIIKKNTLITQQHIENAKRSGKIKELTTFSI